MNIGEGISGAVFNDSEHKYRYALWRIWDTSSGDRLLFVGLNPSTAGAIKDDPTIRRMVGFAKTFGFGGLYVGNLYSFVSANPDRLYTVNAPDLPNGPNDEAIKRMRELTTMVVVGWGEWASNAGLRPKEVITLLGEPVHCLKINNSGEPTHPLYLPANTKIRRYYRDIKKREETSNERA